MASSQPVYERSDPLRSGAVLVDSRRKSAVFALSNFWKFHLLIWLGYGIGTMPMHFAALYYYSIRWHGSAGDVILFRVLSVTSAILISAGMREVYHKVLSPASGWVVRVVAIGVLSFGAAVLTVFIEEMMFHRLGNFRPQSPTWDAFFFLRFSQFMIHLSLYVTWSVLYLVIRRWHADREMARHLLEMENDKIKMELRMLRAQIQPHFLYNALNTIAYEMGSNPRLEKVMESMTEYLRYGLNQRNDSMVEIGTEMDAIRHYLNVEKERFEEGLDVEIDVDPASRAIATPGVFIQPLLENALKYGRFASPGLLRLRLATELAGPDLVITVANSGAWVEPAARKPFRSTAVGLENLSRRLRLLYPGAHSLEISAAEGWVVARVILRNVAAASGPAVNFASGT